MKNELKKQKFCMWDYCTKPPYDENAVDHGTAASFCKEHLDDVVECELYGPYGARDMKYRFDGF